jgi:hypothetical protein
MLTPGSGMLPALTVPCTRPPTARVVDVEGVVVEVGTVVEGAVVEAGGAAGVDCALAGVTRRLASKHVSDAEIWVIRRHCGERS